MLLSQYYSTKMRKETCNKMYVNTVIYTLPALYLLIQLNYVKCQDDVLMSLPDAKCGDQVCYGELGCFNITDDFCKHPQYRKTNKLPEKPSTIGTKFLLFTNKNKYTPQVINPTNRMNITNSNFNAKHKTIFICHGFMGSCDKSDFMLKAKKKFLQLGDFNVILVDWRDGCSSLLQYIQAAANTRVVGAEIARLIQKLGAARGTKPEDCYIVGHSLGAHTAGYAGERLQRLGRITGLDPAAPEFSGMPPTVRLDKGDAVFVDVIHTDIEKGFISKITGLGIPEPIGHMDFYPNNGTNQPGCLFFHYQANPNIPTKLFGGSIGCNHGRSHGLYVQSIILKNVPPTAYHCENWGAFVAGKCGSCGSNAANCALMGYHAIKSYKPGGPANLKFFTKTDAKKPFWVGHYQVTIKISSKSELQAGLLQVRLQGSQDYAEATTTKQQLKPGNSYEVLVTTTMSDFNIEYMEISWSLDVSFLQRCFAPFAPVAKIKLEKVLVLPMSVTNLKEQSEGIVKFCSNQTIPEKKAVKFTKCSTVTL